MIKQFGRHLVSAVCAVTMLFSAVGSPFSRDIAFAENSAELSDAGNNEPELCRQSIALYPNGEESPQVITLEGMMPEGAEAKAVDVSEEHDGIAAYDITITDGNSEYQPDENEPVFVEISDPAIPEGGDLELWHIKENGEREQIMDFTAEDGKISFYAAGFSVYEIVKKESASSNPAASYELTQVTKDTFSTYSSKGVIIKQVASGYYLTSEELTNKQPKGLMATTDPSAAAAFYFEPASGSYYRVYCIKNGEKHYIKKDNKNLLLTTNKEDATANFAMNADFNKLKSGGNKTLGYANSYFTCDGDHIISLYYYESLQTEENDPFELNGKDYGLFHYTDSATKGEALMGEGDAHSLVKLIIKADQSNRSYYVDEDNEIDKWKFTYHEDTKKYTLSAEHNDIVKYLRLDGDAITVAQTEAEATQFTVKEDEKGRVQLSANGAYIGFSADKKDFCVTGTAGADTWLWLLNQAVLTDDDLITFSADRVSVSDIKNGDKVILYIRIWNEQDLRYDMYAVDHNGTLYPCYASGGKIMWLGDGTCSLEWKFTEYLDPVTKQPNYYYELYNPYSEKYIAPQLTGTQLLSENTIGINLQGRRDGEFYSDIRAWDEIRYAYVGLRPNADKTALEPCALSAGYTFYFATLEELNLSDRLHTVPTLDNNDYGIKMKMVDFGIKPGSEYGNADSSEATEFLGNPKKDQLVKGILSTDLKKNGYPVVTENNSSLADLFQRNDPKTVNHLFLEREHESSGYFDFDSCQNFATLRKLDEDGNAVLDANNRYVFNTQENKEINFTVLRELGTHDQHNKNTRKHGQFFPYDTIKADVNASLNPQNLYDALGNDLKYDDPRKYESLHLIQTQEQKNADFYFGMELEADFVQTPSGLDAWGHDIIFEFTGDDDFWLYVDNELILDLGGTHSAMQGKVNFRTGDVFCEKNGITAHSDNSMEHKTLREIFENNYKQRNPNASAEEVNNYLADYFSGNETVFSDYSQHTMRIFYMERGAGASNLSMHFNLAAVTPGHVVLSKELSGDGADALDKDFLEYPFQIYYRLPDGPNGEPGVEHLLGNGYEGDRFVGVTYQNSNQPVRFVQSYRPPGFTEEQSYTSIYFINPTKNAEISFPDGTINYRIVECAVDSTVYGNVKINGQAVPDDRIQVCGDLRSYQSEVSSAEERPTLAFDNYVNDNVIKDLFITKVLLDENNQQIENDPATFSFRLSLSSVDTGIDSIPLANMHAYYVLAPGVSITERKICRYDPDAKTFKATSLTYSHENIQKVDDNLIEGITHDDITFMTSGFGSISGIPSGYTICVPGLPVGAVFKVTEDVKTGYGLDSYQCEKGSIVDGEGHASAIPSYYKYDENTAENIGKVRVEENPQMSVRNKKGYSLTVQKQWSDLDITTSHSPVYVAVYVDGKLMEDSVRQIKSPAVSAYYFWTGLKNLPNGSTRTTLNGYEVREVTLSSKNPKVDENGVVTDYGTVTVKNSGDSLDITAVRTDAATPQGETHEKSYEYVVTYSQGKMVGSSRTDKVTNTRNGGIALRLFRWNSTEPLQGGEFTLCDSRGNELGTYTSSSDGIITMMYSFERGALYSLVQTTAPKGYVGMQKTLVFRINDDETASLFYENGTEAWGGSDLKWANSKQGINGISTFIDVYNKQFNFKIVKTDSEDSGIMLGSAHFALYKEMKTSISGYVKNKYPMTGFEDMETDNGEVDVCGGNSGRVISPGKDGSVYFLTETEAPFYYDKLKEDIIFRISPLGVPSLISNAYQGSLVETEESYIYTLSVPNVKREGEFTKLTIVKKVAGSYGNKTAEFSFQISVSGDDENAGYQWVKNNKEQKELFQSGGTFSLKHNDTAEIFLPKDKALQITVTEENQGYSTTYRIDDGAVQEGSTMQFVFNDSMTLTVINTLNGDIATGLSSSMTTAILLTVVPMIPLVAMICLRRRRKESA